MEDNIIVRVSVLMLTLENKMNMLEISWIEIARSVKQMQSN